MAKTADGFGLDPALLTDEVTAKICEAVRIGVALEGAARYAGIQRDTFWKWFRVGRKEDADPVYREFVAAVDEALADFEITAVGKVFGAEDWRAARSMLAMRFPDRYSEKRLLEVRGQIQAVPWIDEDKLDADELETLRALVEKAQPSSREIPQTTPRPMLELEAGEAA